MAHLHIFVTELLYPEYNQIIMVNVYSSRNSVLIIKVNVHHTTDSKCCIKKLERNGTCLICIKVLFTWGWTHTLSYQTNIGCVPPKAQCMGDLKTGIHTPCMYDSN